MSFGKLLLITLLVANAAQADPTLSESERRLLQAFGPWPQLPAKDPGNELSGLLWAEVLGKQLFNDTALSGDGSLSCASCHVAVLGFSDGLPVAAGAELHVRNSQGLLDVGLQRWFGWDGGADSLWSATLRPLLSEIEMAGDISSIASHLRALPDLMARFDSAEYSSTDDEALIVFASKTIASYLRTLQSGITLFDEFRLAVIQGAESDSNYPLEARRGLSIFLGEGSCHVCHFGPNFSNREFHDTGRPFFTGVGQVDAGRYTGIQRVRADRYNLLGQYNGTQDVDEVRKTDSVTLGQVNFGQWKTPSLRNLVHTAPYMHDGSLKTLRDVVDAYADIDPERIHSNGEAVIRPLHLNDQQRNDLVSFLQTLSAE